jgi:hypothetical protein
MRALALLSSSMIAGIAPAHGPVAIAAGHEQCGWLIQADGALRDQPDPALKPSDPAPLPTPPAQAKAAYCVRDTIITNVGDERLIKAGLPLVLRSGEREGVLEYPPQVRFDYHRDGDRYLPGRPENHP